MKVIRVTLVDLRWQMKIKKKKNNKKKVACIFFCDLEHSLVLHAKLII